MNLLKRGNQNWTNDIKAISSNKEVHVRNIQALQKIFAEMQQTVDYLNFNDTEMNSPKGTITTQQDHIGKYIQNLFNLSMYLDISTSNSFFEFEWKGKCKIFSYSIKSFSYEIACMFYNFSVLYLNQAYNLLQVKDVDPESLKMALKFLRTSMWGFKECSLATKNAIQLGTPVVELNNEHINAAYYVASSLAYFCLFKILRPSFDKFTNEQRYSFFNNCYLSFQTASQYYVESSKDQFAIYENIKQFLSIYKTYFMGSILLEKALEAESKQKININKGDIGYQIGYLSLLEGLYKDMKKYSGNVKNPELIEFIQKAEREIAKLNNLNYENKEIYRCKVPGKEELMVFPESQHKVMPLEQANVKSINPEIEMCFDKSHSFAYRSIENGLSLLLNKNRESLKVSMNNITFEKTETYRKYNIDCLMSENQNKVLQNINNNLNEIRNFGGNSGIFESQK